LTFRSEKFWRARFSTDDRSIFFAAHAPGDPGLIATFAVDIGVPEARHVAIPENRWLTALSATELWITEASTGEVGTLSRVPLTGGAPRPVVRDVVEADVTEDGAVLAVERFQDGRFWLEWPLGHIVYEGMRELMFPRLSPDGQRVVAIARRHHSDQ